MGSSSSELHGLIVGGGIAGLASALALGQGDSRGAPGNSDKPLLASLALWERAPAFAEVGAGIQLGANATRILTRWGLKPALSDLVCVPQSLAICAAHARGHSGARSTIAERPLGTAFEAQYGSPYWSVHRADLHQVLLRAVIDQGFAQLACSTTLKSLVFQPEGWLAGADVVSAPGQNESQADVIHQHFDLLLGCDGGFSHVRETTLGDGKPRPTGQIAYRALLPMADVTANCLRNRITVWLGPKMHAVAYPLKGGALLNLVVIVEEPISRLSEGWDLRPSTPLLPFSSQGLHPDLVGLIEAVAQWRYWVLCDRPPITHVSEMAPRSNVALLGDAAHPMLPFLAQGAGMAIEDACQLALSLAELPSAQQAMAAYAQARARRNARVQATARRNAFVFHASGPIAYARDLVLGMAPGRVLDLPWLYGYTGQLQ
jgi:salicylate hydroxylase